MATTLDPTKAATLTSEEVPESSKDTAGSVAETAKESLDSDAMEAAKRAQNRIKEDEHNVPGDSIFTK